MIDSALAAALDQVKARNAEAIAVHTDMRTLAAVQNLARCIGDEFGPPWLVCSASGMSVEVTLWRVIHNVEVFAADLVRRGAGHIVNMVSADPPGSDCAASCVAVMHAIVGLSEVLYRELDILRSQVGVTLVCPKNLYANPTMAAEPRHFAPPFVRNSLRKNLPHEAIAEEIFAAFRTRRFRVLVDADPMPPTSHTVVSNPTQMAHSQPGVEHAEWLLG